MDSFKILSVSKNTVNSPPGLTNNPSFEGNDVQYTFTLVYGTESFQLQKSTEELKRWISSTVEVFPTFVLESQSIYHESSKSFLLENLKSYFNKVFQLLYDDSIGSNSSGAVTMSGNRGILAYPKILEHIDNTLVSSTLTRASLLLQQNKIQTLTEQVEKLQARLLSTEELIYQCKTLTESLVSGEKKSFPSSATEQIDLENKHLMMRNASFLTDSSTNLAATTNGESVNPGRDAEGESKVTSPAGRNNPLPLASDLEEEIEPDEDESDTIIYPSYNADIMDQVVQYFRANIQTLGFFSGPVDHLLQRIQPRPIDVSHRLAIIDYLKTQIRLSLSCSLFVTDTEAIGVDCFGSNKIVITLLIGKSYQASWDSILFEHLQYLAETSGHQNHRHSRYLRKSSDPSLEANPSLVMPSHDPSEASALTSSSVIETDVADTFFIKNIKLYNEDAKSLYPYITCSINQRLVEIRTDPTIDLCFLGLMEEIAAAIGKENLFKRSFSLITSFLNNELRELYVKLVPPQQEGKKMPSKIPSIPSNITWIMICAVFNKYFSFIETPLQALVLFLIEFSVYDPVRTVITIYGVLELRMTNSNFSGAPGLGGLPTQLQSIFLSKSNYLIKPKMLEKYWNAVNVEEIAVNSDVFNSTLVMNPSVNKKFQPNMIAFLPFSPLINCFSAVHPFSYQVLQTDEISLKTTANQLAEIFQFGLMKFNSLMEVISSVNRDQLTESFCSEAFLNHIFPRVEKKLVKIENKPAIKPKVNHVDDLPYVRPDKYMDAIYYCNFILKSIITEPAILYACIEMIDMKGTLPVGEIGKVVTLHSNIAQLSLHLKEKFGGLKKFLEKFPGIFVFGNDHQYNPHVFLRERLSVDHQRMTYKSILPMQIILQYKKAKNNRKASKRLTNLAGAVGGSNGSVEKNNNSGDSSSLDSSNHALTPAVAPSPSPVPASAQMFSQSGFSTYGSSTGLPSGEYTSFGATSNRAAVGGLEIVPPGIFKNGNGITGETNYAANSASSLSTYGQGLSFSSAGASAQSKLNYSAYTSNTNGYNESRTPGFNPSSTYNSSNAVQGRDFSYPSSFENFGGIPNYKVASSVSSGLSSGSIPSGYSTYGSGAVHSSFAHSNPTQQTSFASFPGLTSSSSTASGAGSQGLSVPNSYSSYGSSNKFGQYR